MFGRQSKDKNLKTYAIDKICLPIEFQLGNIIEFVFLESEVDECGSKTVGIKNIAIDDGSGYVEPDFLVNERKIHSKMK